MLDVIDDEKHEKPDAPGAAASDLPRVAIALDAMDSMARDACVVRALEKAIAREEREQDEKMALFDELERYYLDDLACLADEIGAHGAQMARFTELIHLLKGEGWVHG